MRLFRFKTKQAKIKIELDTNKVYICILMADYDSATPLYDFYLNFGMMKTG